VRVGVRQAPKGKIKLEKERWSALEKRRYFGDIGKLGTEDRNEGGRVTG